MVASPEPLSAAQTGPMAHGTAAALPPGIDAPALQKDRPSTNAAPPAARDTHEPVVGQEMETRDSLPEVEAVPSIPSGADHVVPSKIAASPPSSVARQKSVLAHETERRLWPESTETGAHHNVPFQLSSFPSASTATQKAEPAHETPSSRPDAGSMTWEALHPGDEAPAVACPPWPPFERSACHRPVTCADQSLDHRLPPAVRMSWRPGRPRMRHLAQLPCRAIHCLPRTPRFCVRPPQALSHMGASAQSVRSCHSTSTGWRSEVTMRRIGHRLA